MEALLPAYKAVGDHRYRETSGLYEDFVPCDVFEHRPGRTVLDVDNLHHAYRRPEFLQGHYVVFHRGPSATADIEGVLIHGAQGVRTLTVLPLPRAARPPNH